MRFAIAAKSQAAGTTASIILLTAESGGTRPTTSYGRAQQRREDRSRVLVAAHVAHPERFVRGVPQVPRLPTAVWTNKPTADRSDQFRDQPDQSDQIEVSSLN